MAYKCNISTFTDLEPEQLALLFPAVNIPYDSSIATLKRGLDGKVVIARLTGGWVYNNCIKPHVLDGSIKPYVPRHLCPPTV